MRDAGLQADNKFRQREEEKVDEANSGEHPHFEIGQAALVDEGLPGVSRTGFDGDRFCWFPI